MLSSLWAPLIFLEKPHTVCGSVRVGSGGGGGNFGSLAALPFYAVVQQIARFHFQHGGGNHITTWPPGAILIPETPHNGDSFLETCFMSRVPSAQLHISGGGFCGEQNYPDLTGHWGHSEHNHPWLDREHTLQLPCDCNQSVWTKPRINSSDHWYVQESNISVS